MANVAIFDELADPQRVTEYLRSVNTPEYAGRPDVVIDPDVSLLDGIVPLRYWKHLAGAILEMTQGEKDAVDAAEAAARLAAARADATGAADLADGTGVRTRALIQVNNRRINYLTQRVQELQNIVAAMLASAGPAENMRAAGLAADTISPTTTRNLPTAIQQFKDDIAAGLVDPS